jgi:hypothetical protein
MVTGLVAPPADPLADCWPLACGWLAAALAAGAGSGAASSEGSVVG